MATKSPPGETPPGGSDDRGSELRTGVPEGQLPGDPAATLRIGEVAKLAGLTTRTLRYWEELGLMCPSGYRESGERLYSPADANRAARIRELQDLLGFSLAEVRMALDTEDVFDQLRNVISGDFTDARLLQMVDEAIVANDRLMTRLDGALARINAFRDERASKAERLRRGRVQLVARFRAGGEPDRPAAAHGERPG